MQINTLQARSPRVTSARVGRGGSRGKTSGRGTKGQNARSGHKKRPEVRDMIKKLPKRRGFGKNRSRTVRPQTIFTPVNLSALEKNFAVGEIVSPITLIKKGLVGSSGGFILPVKILGTGTLTKKLVITDCIASAAARSAIEKAGGSFAVATP